MGNVGFFVAEGHWSNKPLHFDGLASKRFAYESCFCDHTFPGLALALSGPEHLEHLFLRNTANLGEGYSILGGPFLALLFDSAGESFGILLALTVQKVGGKGAIRNGTVVLVLNIALVVGLEGLFELHFLRMTFRVEDLGFQAEGLLCDSRRFVGFAGLSLASEGGGVRRDRGKKNGRCALALFVV